MRSVSRYKKIIGRAARERAAAPTIRRILLKKVGMSACIGKGQDKFIGFGIEVQENPIVFYMAITKTFKVARERMIFVLRGQGFSHGKSANNGGNLVNVFPSFKHFLQTFLVTRSLADCVFHESINSTILSGSVHVGVLGSYATFLASLYASTSRSCLLLRVRANGIPPTSRTFAIKQLNAVDMFMPISSRMSSTSALSSASVRNVIVVVIVCTPIVNTTVSSISHCSNNSNMLYCIDWIFETGSLRICLKNVKMIVGSEIDDSMSTFAKNVMRKEAA